MFIHPTARFNLTKVIALLHVFLACVSLPVAVSDDHSDTLVDHHGSARRTPSLSFRIFERSNNGGLPTGSHAIPHRRSNNHEVKKDENFVLRRVPVSSRRRLDYRRASFNKNHNINENTYVFSNAGSDTRSADYADDIVSPEIKIRDKIAQADGDEFNVDKVEAKLQSCVTFRKNVIVVFGQILRAPNNVLTIDQFSSLNLIMQTLIRKQVYIFDMLPILVELQDADKESQLKLVIRALANNVPVYIASACEFWLNEIEKRNVNVEKLIAAIEEPADFFTGIDPEVIGYSKVKVAAEELEPFDEASEVTNKTLGPVFVNIFDKLKGHEIKLSQKLFGAILMNLPIGHMNPVLEESIDYIWDVMQNSSLLSWDEVAPESGNGNPYELVNSVLRILLKNVNTPYVLRHPLKYILMHLKKVPITFADEYYMDMQILSNNNKNVQLMLSMIQDDFLIPGIGDLRDRMIEYVKDNDIDDILQGMNKYNYEKPMDLLIAVLTRIHGRIQNKDMSDTAAKLLSILMSKEVLGSFAVTVPSNVDLAMLLDFLRIPYSDPAISVLGEKIQKYLEGDLELSDNLQDLVSKEDKSRCHRPIQCLRSVFTKSLKSQAMRTFGLPPKLLKTIESLLDRIKNLVNSAKCEYLDGTPMEHPETPNDPINVEVQPIPTSKPLIPGQLNSTEAPIHWPVTPSVPTDDDDIIFKPDYPDSHNSEEGEIIYPAYPGDEEKNSSHPTLPNKDVIFPDGWVVKPIPVHLPGPQPIPTMIPKPGPKPIPIVLPTSVPQIIPTHKPSDKPPLQPVIEPSIVPPTISSKKPIHSTTPSLLPSKKPIVSTTPSLFPSKKPVDSTTQSLFPSKKPIHSTTPSPLPSKKPPAKDKPNDLLPQTENEPVLPPNLSFDQPIYLIFPKDDAPPYTSPTKPIKITEIYIVFPSIKELLEGFESNKPFRPDELPDIPEIFKPLKQILGIDFVEVILGKHVDKTKYPTVISLIDDVLEHALENAEVMANPKLVSIIEQYLKGIYYISTTALFPVVVNSQNIPADILHVTFDPDNPNANSIDSKPPSKVPSGFITLPIYHPKYWVQQVDPVDPYGTLLPSPDEGEDNPIQDLINNGLLQDILGPEFDPLLYPNKGTLLTTVLQKLIVSEKVQSDAWLLQKLITYLKSIKTVALYSKIPNDYHTHIIQLEHNNKVNWQPDTASLITALPPARNQHELNKIKLIKSFLERPNLLELLQIDNPPHSITRGAFLKIVFNAAIRGKKIVLDPKTWLALKHYEHKILMKGAGALPIVWVWVQMFIIREEVPLGEIIESVIDYDSLSRELKISYNDLMTYLSENPQFLQGNDNFPYEKYLTKGTFLKGLFEYFLTKPDMSPISKLNIKKLIPRIKLTGPGAEPMNHVTLDEITNGEIDKDRFSVLLNG